MQQLSKESNEENFDRNHKDTSIDMKTIVMNEEGEEELLELKEEKEKEMLYDSNLGESLPNDNRDSNEEESKGNPEDTSTDKKTIAINKEVEELLELKEKKEVIFDNNSDNSVMNDSNIAESSFNNNRDSDYSPDEVSYKQKQPTNPFECDVCEKSYADSHDLWLHKWTQHRTAKKDSFKCDVSKKSRRECDFTRHKLTHENSNRNEGNSKVVVIPMETKGEERDLSTNTETVVVKEEPLELGEEKEMRESPESCEESFLSNERNFKAVVIPMETRGDERDFLINIETVVVKEEPLGLKEENVSSRESPPDSPLSDTRDFDYSPIKKPQKRRKTALTKPKKPFRCDACGKSYPTVALLEHHKRAHEQTFRCDACEESFPSKSRLSAHRLARHAKQSRRKRYECDVCGEAFSRKYALHVHQRKSARCVRERHVCGACGKSFASERYLRFHDGRSHGREAPNARFECDECGKRFARAHAFRTHKWTHEFSNSQVARSRRGDGEEPRTTILEKLLRSERTGCRDSFKEEPTSVVPGDVEMVEVKTEVKAVEDRRDVCTEEVSETEIFRVKSEIKQE